MNNASYPNIGNLDIKYEHEPFKCVYGALYHSYGWNKQYLFDIFCEYIDECKNIKTNVKNLDMNIENDEEENIEIKNDEVNYDNFNINSGVNTNMLMYLAKKNDISLYAFDWNHHLFNKNISINQNLKPLAYIMANNHMYLITDPNIIKSIAMKSRDVKSLNSNLFREVEIKNNTFELEIFDNILVSELKNYKNCNIMYSCESLDEIHYKIFKINNDLITDVKTSGCKIIYMYYLVLLQFIME